MEDEATDACAGCSEEEEPPAMWALTAARKDAVACSCVFLPALAVVCPPPAIETTVVWAGVRSANASSAAMPL